MVVGVQWPAASPSAAELNGGPESAPAGPLMLNEEDLIELARSESKADIKRKGVYGGFLKDDDQRAFMEPVNICSAAIA